MDFRTIHLHLLGMLAKMEDALPARVLFEKMYSGDNDAESILSFLKDLDEKTVIGLESKSEMALMDSAMSSFNDEETLMLRLRLINASFMFSALSEQIRHDGHGTVSCKCATIQECVLLGLRSFWKIRGDEFLRQQEEFYSRYGETLPPFFSPS